MELFLASIYQYIYIFAIAIITLVFLPQYVNDRTQGILRADGLSNNAYFLLIAVILFIGFRPYNGAFVDMMNYIELLNFYSNREYEFDWNTDNKIFDNFFVWFASGNYDYRYFFLIIAIIYFGAMYCGLKRLFPDNTKLAFLTYLAGFSTFSYSVNGIKAGAAASIFILALSFWDKKVICSILMLISLGFHHSMTMPIGAAVISFFIKNTKFYYAIWGFCLLMAILHITYFQGVFAGMTNDSGVGYLTATEETTTARIAFRPDFVLYSCVPVIMGYYFEIKGAYHLTRKTQFLIHFYILTNAIWLLCMYASFNNRIAYLSWFVYPIVIIAPFLDKRNHNSLRYVELGKAVRYHLYFTMFMVIVYYGILHLGR